MRIDSIPDLNTDLDAMVARLEEHESILSQQLDALRKFIRMTEMAAMREPAPNEKLTPGNAGPAMPQFFADWRDNLIAKDTTLTDGEQIHPTEPVNA